MSAAAAAEAAYDRCEAITREQAGNFYYGIRLLPRERRRAMCAAYAFARRVDDVGDGTALSAAEKLRLLDGASATIAAVGAGAGEGSASVPGAGAGGGADGIAATGAGRTAASGAGAVPDGDGPDPVLVALSDAHARFDLPLGALEELVEGVRMDVRGVTYERFEDLVPYCRRVAGSIGRVCLAIFGLRERSIDRLGAEALADDLGVALQLTNILRDVREDAENGRIYLPAEDLRRFGLQGDGSPPPAAALLGWIEHGQAGPRELVRFQAERAREWFDRGLELVPLLDRRSSACVLAMAGIYRRLLERIEADPAGALEARMSLPAREKVWVAVRAMVGEGR
jgi:phytoene synthase